MACTQLLSKLIKACHVGWSKNHLNSKVHNNSLRYKIVLLIIRVELNMYLFLCLMVQFIQENGTVILKKAGEYNNGLIIHVMKVSGKMIKPTDKVN